MKNIRISSAIIGMTLICSIFACKKDDQKKKDEPPTGIEGVWDGTVTSGASTLNTIAVFSSSTVKMYESSQLPVDTTKQPFSTGTYKTIGDSIYCTMAPNVYGFVEKDAGTWSPAGNNQGLAYPATINMSFATLDPIVGFYQLQKE
jgi:hypothetical protein